MTWKKTSQQKPEKNSRLYLFSLCNFHAGYVLGEDLGYLKEHLQYHLQSLRGGH